MKLNVLQVLYSKLGYEAPFIASVILCGIDFFMRLVVIEKTDGTVNTESEDMAKEVTSKKKVTWLKLLRQKRLIVSLVLSTIVATVMSAFEVKKKKKKHVFERVLY